MRRTRYTEEERKTIVELVRTSGRSIDEIAGEEAIQSQAKTKAGSASPQMFP